MIFLYVLVSLILGRLLFLLLVGCYIKYYKLDLIYSESKIGIRVPVWYLRDLEVADILYFHITNKDRFRNFYLIVSKLVKTDLFTNYVPTPNGYSEVYGFKLTYLYGNSNMEHEALSMVCDFYSFKVALFHFLKDAKVKDVTHFVVYVYKYPNSNS